MLQLFMKWGPFLAGAYYCITTFGKLYISVLKHRTIF